MANTIKLRRSAVQGTVPTTSQLLLGELGINTYDGKLFLKKSTSGAETGAGTSVIEIGSGAITSSGLTMATARLLGRTTASSGAVEEITVGSGLSLSGGTLSAVATVNGTKTFAVFTPTQNQPPATNFATLDTRNGILVLDFDDGATNEEAVFCGVIPEGATLTSGIKVRIHWMATSATSGNCRWGVQFEKAGTDLDTDSFDTATEAHTATSGTSGIETMTEITATAIDSLAAGDRYRLKVYRDSSDTTNDTMSGDAELIAIEVRSAA